MGVPTKTRVIVPDDLDERTGHEKKDLNAWLKDAMKHHPAIAEAKAQWEAAQSNVVVARSDGMPTVGFFADYYQNGRPDESLSLTSTRETMLGISLTVPIFDGFSTTYKILQARAQAEEKGAELQDTEHKVLMSVVRERGCGLLAQEP